MNLSILLQLFPETNYGTVYHYTSATGLAGIIGNHEIWMTNTAFLNDSSELSTLKKSIPVLKESDLRNDFVKRAYMRMLQHQTRDSSYYVASFCKSKDLLEQWRAYGNFCIGFNANKLNINIDVPLCRCLYRTIDIKKWILKNELSAVWDRVTTDFEREIMAYVMLEIASLKHKNIHFSSEKELRLITISNHNWLFHQNRQLYQNDLPIHVRQHPIYQFPVPYVKFCNRSQGINFPLASKALFCYGAPQEEIPWQKRSIKYAGGRLGLTISPKSARP